MAQTSPSAPAPGAIRIIAPNITDSTPPRISIHSLSISLRSWIAPMISKMPCTSAQAPMNSTSRNAQEANHDQPPGRDRLGATSKSSDERKHAVDEREGTVQENQRHQC